MSALKRPPTTDRGRASLARILDAASELFYRQGVRPTTLDQVAVASGTGKGQLYHYFGGKDDLVLAVVERQVDRVIEAQMPLLGELGSWEAIDGWIELVVESHAVSDDPFRCPLGALVAELATAHPAARAALAAGFERWSGHLADGLRTLQREGRLRADADGDALGGGLLAAYQGGLVLAQASGGIAPLRASLATARAALERWATEAAP
jgi:AcrR family transcriptional regulator